jgi:hypothetical protein
MLKWLLGRKDESPPPKRESPGERLGPEPPPPPSANRPGVTVHASVGAAWLPRDGSRPAASWLGPLEGPPPEPGLSWAAVVLSGAAYGDVVVTPDGRTDLPAGTAALLDGVAGTGETAPLRIERDALAGRGASGVAGARLLAEMPGRTVLRLGPPPAARWAIVGLRSVAVFIGKLTLVDGDESLDVWAGQVALVADPTATLYVQAGNDAAVAIAFASPGVLVRLG